MHFFQERGSYKVRAINMGVCQSLEFDYLAGGMTFIFMAHLSFHAVPFLIYNVMYDITTIPEGTLL